MLKRYGTFQRMFELHHVDPDKKDPNYNNLIKQKLSTKQIDEIDKCVLLCRECHGIIHAQNIRAKVKLELQYAEKTVSQEFNAWVIHDAIDKKIHFLSDEKLLLNPYYSKLNDEEENLLFGTDLQSGEFFNNMLRSLKEGDTFSIFKPETKKCLFQVTHLKDTIKIEHSVEFELIASMEAQYDDQGSRIWYRNGMLLSEDGEVIEKGVITLYMDPKRIP